MLFTDAATRLTNELKDGAVTLGKLDQERLEITHRPLSFQEGVHGSYEVVFEQSVGCTKCGSLYVANLNTGNSEYRAGGRTTTYHRNFVSVPTELKIRKQKDEAVVIVLNKVGSAIEVDALR